MEYAVDLVGVLYRFVAHYQQKEFVGQKAISQDIEEEVGGESCEEVLDLIWTKVKPLIKREVIVDGDQFHFAENEEPNRKEIGKFVIFQDKSAKTNYTVSQIKSDVLRKMRDKHVNVMVHVYGTAIASKPIHQKMSAAILQPTDRDRAGAHSTVMLTELTQKLKEKHGSYICPAICLRGQCGLTPFMPLQCTTKNRWSMVCHQHIWYTCSDLFPLRKLR